MEYVLYHHGVKGMKWGHRKASFASTQERKRLPHEFNPGSVKPPKGAKVDGPIKIKPPKGAKTLNPAQIKQRKHNQITKGQRAARTTLGVLGGLALGTAVAYGATVYAANSVTRVLNDWQSELDRL